MENKRMKQIFVLIVIAMLGVFPVIIAEAIDYDVDVQSCMNFSIRDINTTFGSMQTGKSKTLTPSFVVDNTNSSCNVSISALFTTNVSGTYGFINNSKVISADNFQLNNIPLSPSGDVVDIGTVTNGTSKDYDAKLSVPVAQEPVIYNGRIELVVEPTT